MRIYISGPMTGYPSLNYPEFNKWAAHFRSLGFDVLNPAELDYEKLTHRKPFEIELGGYCFKYIPKALKRSPKKQKPEWADFLRRDLAFMCFLEPCHAIFTLPGWQKSRGARLEKHVANWLGIYEVDEDGRVI